MRLCLLVLVLPTLAVVAWPLNEDSREEEETATETTAGITTEVTTQTETTLSNRVSDYFEQKINEMAGVSCEVCLKAVYGINYNVIRLKKAAEDMVKEDCEAIFHNNGEFIARCIRAMVEKIEHYYEKVEPMIDTRNLCVKMKMCAPQKI